MIRSQIKEYQDKKRRTTADTHSTTKDDEEETKEERQPEHKDNKIEDGLPIHRAINKGLVNGFAYICKQKGKKSRNDIYFIELSTGITHKVFMRILEFLYTGMATIKDKR